ncbi:flavodoxin family protein [Chloroflexota bacterium]
MKVLGIVCSPRRGGNTEVLVEEALSSAKEFGAEVELVTLADKNITPCDGCESCEKSGKCRIEDDMQEMYSKLLETDGVIFGTPVYFWSATAQAKALIDRTYVLLQGRRLRNKVAGVIVVARRTGTAHAFSVFQSFFNLQFMVPAGAVAFGKEEEMRRSNRMVGAIAYAGEKGEVREDRRGMAEAAALGRNIVKTIQSCRKSGLI